MHRVIFLIAISLLIFWMVSPILMKYFSLEFNDKSFESNFISIRFFGVPTCILLTLFGTIKSNHKKSDRITFTVLTFGLATFAFFVMIGSILSGMCDWSNRETLFVNKENQNIKIIQREYGCGAMDSDAPFTRDFKVNECSKYFIIATEIDLEKMNKNVWIEVKK
jgi:hypothetical protein